MSKGIKELENKIKEKAEKEAGQLISRAKKARKRIIDRAEEEAEEIIRNARQKGKKMYEREQKKIHSEKIIDEKKEILTVREKIIDRVKNDLEKKLYGMMKKGEMNSWIENRCREIKEIEEDDLTFVTSDEEIYRDIVKNLDGIQLKKEPVENGFLLRTRDEEYDFRLNVLIENLIKKNRISLMKEIEVENG